MKNDLRETDELFIHSGCCVLEDFLFVCLYTFSCIEKQVMTLNQLRFLSCSASLDTNIDYLVPITISHYCHQYQLRPNPPITGVVPCPLVSCDLIVTEIVNH